jgi:cell fate regulator YaaT (PSP1 superfamily)
MDVFEPVSMRMAKEQSLFLNPSKFSGNCGKLKCCLRYEHDFYSKSHRDAVEIGSQLETPSGTGRVVELNVLKGTCVVEVPEAGRVEVRLSLETHAPTATCTHAGEPPPGADPERSF